MAIKSEIVKDDVVPCKPFPKLMTNLDRTFVVLFIQPQCGAIVQADAALRPIGDYSDTWCDDQFTDFNGVVRLSNE